MQPSFVLLSRSACVAAAFVMAPIVNSLAAQPASFVYRLGVDTLAIEQYTRTATGMTGEMVQRSGGAVALTKYTITLGKDGRPTAANIKRLQPNGNPFPNAPTETRFVLRADSAIREVVFTDSVQRRAFAAKGAMVNFPVFVYGPMELLAAMRKSGAKVDSLPAIGAGGGLAYTGLEALAGDTLRQRGGSYAMVLLFDANSRMQLMDGSKTTNKSVATRGTGGMDLAAMARTMKPTGVLSARDIARAAFGAGGMVLIDYSRPHVRERTVWGGTLVPFDSVWRTGANDATHLMTTRVLTFGDMVLQPGMYTLWVQHTRSGTYLIVNKQTGQWGTQYNAANDVGRVLMVMSAAPSHVEEMTISVAALSGSRGEIGIAWGGSVGKVGFGVAVAR